MFLLQLLDAEITEFVGFTLLPVVLDADDAFCVLRILDFGGDHTIDFDADFIALATDAVGVPVVALEGIACALAKFCFAGLIALDRAGEPHTATFIVEATGPFSVRVTIDFRLVAEDFVFFCMRAEHEAAVGLSGGEENLAFEDEIAVCFLGNEEKLLVAREMDFIADNFGFTPSVGIFPAVESFAIEEWFEFRLVFC